MDHISHYFLLSLPNGSSKFTFHSFFFCNKSGMFQILLSLTPSKAQGCMIKWNGIYRKRDQCSSNKGETSQSLSLSDLFKLNDGKISPVLKDSKLYHFSMFHASHHIVSVPATKDEVFFTSR
ncbi:hypothetical protein EUTSA_v10000377mg [Eutrema salsugineum]|uniref:Uncharacterized protein n=1 Tax=Eutrema salsugineum TaxID=72664 RepID=V4L7M6_EUTSA|nr:uncharacterized protein LOC18022085 [Eutrema salsugineum]ESQ46370.1 hypothetical protein EUTSA_v10000377mg [Eutrema salsugineum]